MTQSMTANIADDMALYGQLDPELVVLQDAPDDLDLETLVEHIFDNTAEIFTGSCLELDISDLLWQIVNVFHRKAQRLEHELDANILRQRALMEQQDGSEIASYELEIVHATGVGIQKRLTAMEHIRLHGTQVFQQHTGDSWLPKSGSLTHRKTLTASMVDARDFANANKLAKTEMLVPKGKKIIVAGDNKCTDVNRVYGVLDKTLQLFTDRGEKIVLVHGGDNGVDKIADSWARNRNVATVVMKPDWSKHSKAAPFKRNDEMLALLPAGLIMVAKNNGIHEQLLREAQIKGITIHLA